MIKGGLYLQWSLAHERTQIIEYQLEYETVNTKTKPQSLIITPAPDDCLHRVDGLSPGFTYCLGYAPAIMPALASGVFLLLGR